MSKVPQVTVLLVDADASLGMRVRAALARHGFVLIDAPDGATGLARFRAERPDILLVNATLPGMDGFAVCRSLRELPEGEDVPIVVLTGPDDDAIGQAYDAGATDFYVMTPEMVLLAERLRYVMRTARIREELARSRAKLAAAQRIARLGSWDWDLARRSVTASDECRRILGLAGEDGPIPEERFIRLFYPDGNDAFRFEVLSLLRAGRGHLVEGLVQLPGGPRSLEIEVGSERDAKGTMLHVNGTIQDVTERRDAEAQLRRLADFDGLTGLANRTLFRGRLEEAIGAGRDAKRRLAVMVLGLDRFKLANEALGQSGGDALLREVAQRLNATARSRDAVARGDPEEGNAAVARLGADEFAVLLHDLAGREDAGTAAERVLEALRRPYLIGGNAYRATASAGLALYPEDADSGEALLSRASAAMRDAKAAGRNVARFFERAGATAGADKLHLEADLRRALERGELLLHWQPIIDLRTGRVLGAEALMRWRRGDRLVPPGEFIPLAEETGLIVPMGEWALETSCAQLADWRAEGHPPIYAGVNLTASHVQQHDIERYVGDLLARWRLPSDALSLEITESRLMDFLQPTLRGLHALRRLGVRIAIDDFGTGYSSLSYLKRLPVSTIKIDRSFVTDVATDRDDAVIVSAIAGLAGSLSLSVVAEGVETPAQRDALAALGIVQMQGRLFGEALSAADFTHMLDGNPSADG